MEIYINGQQAALKEGSSFDYVFENRAFTGADDYTLNITLPLAGCPQNVAIFGRVNRKDVAHGKVSFRCDIRDRAFFRSGIITITSISEAELKCQFLEGRSEHNFLKGFDEIYINELELGKYTANAKSAISPEHLLKDIDSSEVNSVCLPWVNNSSGNMQNGMYYDEDTKMLQWEGLKDKTLRLFHDEGQDEDKEQKRTSHQPYLIFITKKICEGIGYSFDFAEWEQSTMRFVIICNTLPAAWGDTEWAHVLPHWSVKEYFQQLEYLLRGEFDFDHKEQRVSFHFTREVVDGISETEIEDVVDEFSAEVTKEDESEYIGGYDIAVKDAGHRMQNFYSCQWYVELMRNKTATLSGGGGVVSRTGSDSGSSSDGDSSDDSSDDTGNSSGTGTTGGGGVSRGGRRLATDGDTTIFAKARQLEQIPLDETSGISSGTVASSGILHGVQEYETFEAFYNFAKAFFYMPGQKWNGRSQSGYGTYIEDRVNIKGSGLFYVKELDTYFILYCYKVLKNGSVYDRYYRIMPVNQFGTFMPKGEDNDNAIEMGFVPAWLDNADDVEDKNMEKERGNVIFLDVGDKAEGVEDYYANPWSVSVEDRFINYVDDYQDGAILQPQAARAIANGEKETTHEYFSCIFVAWWKADHNVQALGGDTKNFYPCPIIDRVTVFGEDSKLMLTDFDIRPQSYYAATETRVEAIEPLRKYSFSWLADSIPSPRSIFHIRGKRYVCKKITATFTDNGRSQLLRGEFYRLQD